MRISTESVLPNPMVDLPTLALLDNSQASRLSMAMQKYELDKTCVNYSLGAEVYT